MLSVNNTKLISKLIWIFSCILEEVPAISSFFRLFSGHTPPFWNTKYKSDPDVMKPKIHLFIYSFSKYIVHANKYLKNKNVIHSSFESENFVEFLSS